MRRHLDVPKVLLGAFLIPWRERARFARALALPVGLLASLWLTWHYSARQLPGWANWLAYAAYLVVYVLIAVRSHRLVLLGTEEATGMVPSWTRREGRFAGYVLLVWLFMIPLYSLVQVLAFVFVHHGLGIEEKIATESSMWVSSLAMWIAFARFALGLPAIAIDGPFDVRRAWRLSSGNLWRLFAVVGVLPLLASTLIGMLYHTGTHPVVDLLYALLSSGVLVVEVVALSLAYRELLGPE
jgi:hypothetical protein